MDPFIAPFRAMTDRENIKTYWLYRPVVLGGVAAIVATAWALLAPILNLAATSENAWWADAGYGLLYVPYAIVDESGAGDSFLCLLIACLIFYWFAGTILLALVETVMTTLRPNKE